MRATDRSGGPQAPTAPKCPGGTQGLLRRRSAAWAAGESACRPGSVSPVTATWHYAPGPPSDLCLYISRVLNVSGLFLLSGGTEPELTLCGPLR